MARILIVEDNLLTAKGLAYLLEREHHSVQTATNLAQADDLLESANFDLILLDVGLPDGEGFQLAERLANTHSSKTQGFRSAASTIPIIFLTARDDEDEIVRGLSLGAEDYVTKPFRNRELLLRINNTLSRHAKIVQKVVLGDFTVDPNSQTVTFAKQVIPLTALEYRILVCLFEHPGQVVTRAQILDEIWSSSGRIVNDNTISVYLKRLRQKLPNPAVIETVKKLGYRANFTPTEKTSATSSGSSDYASKSSKQPEEV